MKNLSKKQLSETQRKQIDHEREMMVYKATSMVQRGRHDLSPREQKIVIYAISKIKPSDNEFTRYRFELKDFCTVCGFTMDSFTEIKSSLQKLRDRSWWCEHDPIKVPGEYVTVSWFQKVWFNKTDGKVSVLFDTDMMPYLLELVKRGELYTKYEIRYILPMKSQYGIRLYELLKSYCNTPYWWFDIDKLKNLLNAEKYSNFADFKRRVIDPAIKDIDEYSDLNVSYVLEKKGRRYQRIKFYIGLKEENELRITRIHGETKLDEN